MTEPAAPKPCTVVLLDEHSYFLASAEAQVLMLEGVVAVSHLGPLSWGEYQGNATQVRVAFTDHKGGTVTMTFPIEQMQLAGRINDADMGYEEK